MDQPNWLHWAQQVQALAQAGLSREDAYKLVQRNAMATWKEGVWDYMKAGHEQFYAGAGR